MLEAEPKPLTEVLFTHRPDPRSDEPGLAEVISDWYRKNKNGSSSGRPVRASPLPTADRRSGK